MDDKATIDFEAFEKLNRREMVDTIDAYMIAQGIPDNVRNTITLLFGGVTAQFMDEAGGFDLRMDIAQLIGNWLRDKHPDVLNEFINDITEEGKTILRESDGF